MFKRTEGGTPTPAGKDPGDKGDCENPRSMTIQLYEDRWGNHRVTIHEDGKRHKHVVLHRGSKASAPRVPFSKTVTDILPKILKLIEEKKNVPE